MSRIHCLNTAILQEEGRVRCAAAIPVWTKQVPTSHFHPKEDVQRARIFQSIFIKHKKSVYNDHFYCKSWLTGKKKSIEKIICKHHIFFFLYLENVERMAYFKDSDISQCTSSLPCQVRFYKNLFQCWGLLVLKAQN